MPAFTNKVDVLEGETADKTDAGQADKDSGVVASFSVANGGDSQDGATPTSEKDSAAADTLDKPPLEAEVEIGEVVHDRPYAGMGKEDLLRFSDTPFWNRFRLISILLFWALWLALLGAVIGLTIVAPRCGDRPTPSWWQKSVIYQIYVRSFFDGKDDNGIGDIQGIAVLLDFIPNYTARNHTWFLDSSSDPSYTNPFWNFYVWATSATSPNNWLSVTGGSAWTLSTTTARHYLHQFNDSQPELNLRSTAVQNNLTAILKFWLDKGIDGFKVSSTAYLFESTDFKDESRNNDCAPQDQDHRCLDHIYTMSQPENIDVVRRWRDLLDQYYKDNQESSMFEKILLTDADVSVSDSLKYYGLYGDGAQLPINYQLSNINYSTCNGFCIRAVIQDWINGLPQQGRDTAANWLTGNQDRQRIASLASSYLVKAINVVKLTLPGSAFVYYGEEIGMTDVEYSNVLPQYRYRSPMQWGSGLNANFSSTTPWLPVSSNYTAVNVENQTNDESTLGIFKALTTLRRDESFQYGALHFIATSDNNTDILAYVREHEGFDRYLVVANFGPEPISFDLTKDKRASISIPKSAELVLRTDSSISQGIGDNVDLRKLKINPGVAFIAKWEYIRP